MESTEYVCPCGIRASKQDMTMAKYQAFGEIITALRCYLCILDGLATAIGETHITA